MAQNYIEDGDLLDYTVATGETLTSGRVVVKGDIVGVALGSGTEGDVVTIQCEGVFEVPKAADAIDLGDKLYWDATAGKVTTDDDGGANPHVGSAWSAQLTGDATVKLRIKCA